GALRQLREGLPQPNAPRGLIAQIQIHDFLVGDRRGAAAPHVAAVRQHRHLLSLSLSPSRLRSQVPLLRGIRRRTSSASAEEVEARSAAILLACVPPCPTRVVGALARGHPTRPDEAAAVPGPAATVVQALVAAAAVVVVGAARTLPRPTIYNVALEMIKRMGYETYSSNASHFFAI
ncbi:unnamed protein product, partial [Urochloa humidicola]